MNKVLLIGRLTRDPELTVTASGISICKFCIAINRSFANANGEREADFLNIVTWRGLADNCAKYLVKGRKVAVCGSIQTRSYDDKEGVKRYVTEVIADEVEFLTPLSEEAPSTPAASGKKKVSDLQPINENEDLPF